MTTLWGRQEDRIEGESLGSDILKEEFKAALRKFERLVIGKNWLSQLKKNEPCMKKDFGLVQEIYTNGILPPECEKSIVVPIPKKPDAKKWIIVQ